jgi:hypothetical protein
MVVITSSLIGSKYCVIQACGFKEQARAVRTSTVTTIKIAERYFMFYPFFNEPILSVLTRNELSENSIPMIMYVSNHIILKILIQHKTLQEIIAFCRIIPWRFIKNIILQLGNH